MPTAFDLLSHDPTLQRHWLKRFLAAVIDVLLVFVPVSIFMIILAWNVGTLWYLGGLISGFIWFAYSSFLEYTVHCTIGKFLMGLRVVSIKGRAELYQMMMRNLTKFFALFLIIDFLAGMIVETTDPRQKYTDRMAGTSVIVHKDVPF